MPKKKADLAWWELDQRERHLGANVSIRLSAPAPASRPD